MRIVWEQHPVFFLGCGKSPSMWQPSLSRVCMISKFSLSVIHCMLFYLWIPSLLKVPGTGTYFEMWMPVSCTELECSWDTASVFGMGCGVRIWSVFYRVSVSVGSGSCLRVFYADSWSTCNFFSHTNIGLLPASIQRVPYLLWGSLDNCSFIQCCGSMTFWGGSGSGSADPCLWLMDLDPDPDPAIFVIDLQDASKKLIFYHSFFCFLLFEGTFTSFFKDKKSKRVTK